MNYTSFLGSRSVPLLTVLVSFSLLLIGCVRDETSEQVQESPKSALEEISEQLDRPLQRVAATPTAGPEQNAGRWKAFPKARQEEKPVEDPAEIQRKLLAEIFQAQDDASWPAQIGEQFPIMPMLAPNLEKRSTELFRGKVTLIEYASLASPATQALAGAGERGPYGAVALYPSLKRLEQYFPDYAGGIQFNEINRVQILMVDLRSQIVSPALAKAWSEHFELESKHGRIVLIASSALLQGAGTELLGGFQLLDKNMVVRADASGERSKTLFSVLFPLIPRLVR